ncbi:hypothetical protein O3G_MSEX003816 [Manduca sexta]|nr:hypothetical protein O3G_MSEX003816 [Manduca sexta]KAG6445280.1 hypothetical protein O3G_MSEX003816 [Manduca sexta]KAG6445281.1 hypothetical protein O3G_MSEX003816 [Manduca sexta]
MSVNSDMFTNPLHLDLSMHFSTERIPERTVYAKGTGALGYFTVTHDVSQYTKANLFNEVGKQTPVLVRFSQGLQSLGGSDLARGLKGMSVKFYTKEGNFDIICIQTPVYLYRDPLYFSALVRSFKKNPRTNLNDVTSRYDFLTSVPTSLHGYLWTQADYGVPDGYRRMDAFPVHTYELSNQNGERYYVRFNFRTEQGLANLTSAQASEISGRDPDYYARDLYNAIAQKNFPAWKLEMDVMSLLDIKGADYDPFDLTRLWKNGTYETVQVGRLVLSQNPDNYFRVIEQSAFNPGNLVPGIPGPVDYVFKARRLFYQHAQTHRLGSNFNNIEANCPRYVKTYNRDGAPPLGDNMRDYPNYYPNSYNGPLPYVDDSRPSQKLIVLHSNAADLQPHAYFYNHILKTDDERQRMVDNIVPSLLNVTPPVLQRVINFMYLIDPDLGRRVTIGLEAARAAVNVIPAVTPVPKN